MPIEEIDPKTAKAWLDADEAVLMDVREAGEFRSEHIAGARHHALGGVCCAALPATDKKIIVHCLRGGRGRNACTKLQAEDNQRVLYHMAGGLQAWKEAGLPTERGARKLLPLDRQVQLTIGILLIGLSILVLTGAAAYVYGTLLIGCGLFVAGATGFCGLARLIAKMPWNK